jgi:hypothetical protein
VDPIKHPRPTQTCFTEALFSNDPQADHLPTSPGARVRLRFQVFASQRLPGVPVGEISTVVEVRGTDKEHAPGTSPAALHAVGY